MTDAASAFFQQHSPRWTGSRRWGRVLDLACGRGRHGLAAAKAGLDVLAVDRNPEALEELRMRAGQEWGPRIETRCLDLETAALPDLGDEVFGAVLVFRYLHRPLSDWIADRIAPGGLLLYETFTIRQRDLGWGPSRADFLLEPGELPRLFPTLETLVYEEGPSADPKPAETARLLARRR